MTLDAYTATFLRLMKASHPDLGGAVTDAGQARRVHALARFPTGPDLAEVRDLTLPGPSSGPSGTAAGLRVRRYRPHRPHRPPGGTACALPVVVYLHGGGWVLCDLDTHDGVCRQLAERAGVIVVAVDYRRAPEHRFPAAADDAYAAVCWVSETAPAWGGDPERVAVAGDSAGGALAAATCLRARDLGGPAIRYQLLVYPVTDCLAPRRRHTGDCLLTAEHMRWYVAQYLADPADGEHPYASPLRAPDLSRLPPCLVLVAEHDPLREEGEAYAARLAASGVPTETRRVDGLFHGLFGLGGLVPVARTAEDIAVDGLRRALHG